MGNANVTPIRDSGFVAVPDVEEQVAGATVWWALAPFSCNREALVAEWVAAGFDARAVPEAPSRAVALRRALQDVAGRRLIQALPERGWCYLDAKEDTGVDGNDLTLGTTLRAWLEDDGTLHVEGGRPERQMGTTRVPSDVEAIRAAFATHLVSLSSEDFSAWLCYIVERCYGVRLRPRGGTYFIPPKRLESWKRRASIIGRVAQHRLYLLPTMRCEDTIVAVFAAAEREAAEQMVELDKHLSEEATPRRLASFGERLHNTARRLAAYEQLLGDRWVSIKASLEAVTAKLADAERAARK